MSSGNPPHNGRLFIPQLAQDSNGDMNTDGNLNISGSLNLVNGNGVEDATLKLSLNFSDSVTYTLVAQVIDGNNNILGNHIIGNNATATL